MLSILINLLIVILVIDAFLLILVVLMQRPKSEGLGAAFGGGMTENIFGAQTSNVLATVTRWLGGIFFGLALLLSIIYARQSGGGSALSREMMKQPVPAAAAAALPVPSAASSAVPVPTATATASVAPSPTAVPSAAPATTAVPVPTAAQ